ncbi:TIGR02611 family protein [Gordonia sp. (in: high G+C Gram-positive bacteria)]|uniref:TIGR02611 family protein n=1 Tax=Gordonia sp. (in: high G+C Gram-positive bacteria) TaxID=84139 RepID=UPI0016975716|nr:TIGR02611 family protein [Gordonia sp. (in: high G+C Gram-positive bacteria)]NLG45836.1 TIGR02611 family protein [Gordonia sp. (in: high G+C Gram-positive bacteria)]
MRLRFKVWHRQQRYTIRQRPALNSLYRFGVGVVGTLMVLAGMVMIPLPIPGPGWVTFFLGLGVLSTEFAWAHRVTTFMRRQLHNAGVLTANVAHAVRSRIHLTVDYRSGVQYLRTWTEHQHLFARPQYALVAA